MTVPGLLSQAGVDMDDEIEKLEQRVRDIESDLHEAKRLLQDAWVSEAPYKVGDEIEVRNRGVWGPAIVRSVKAGWRGYFEYHVSFPRKDGSWGVPRRAWKDAMRHREVNA